MVGVGLAAAGYAATHVAQIRKAVNELVKRGKIKKSEAEALFYDLVKAVEKKSGKKLLSQKVKRKPATKKKVAKKVVKKAPAKKAPARKKVAKKVAKKKAPAKKKVAKKRK